MKPKTMILMGLAIVCGLGASYMTSRLLAERQPVDDEKIEILVAKRNLSIGERIVKPDDFFEKKAVAKADEPPDAIKDFEALKGKMMRQSRNKGDHITATNLIDKNRLDIPEGHYAVGLPVTLVTTAHGLATLPGSRVDVILTIAGDRANNASSRVIIENVLVLAADGITSPDSGALIAPASVVTLALDNKNGLIANTAKEMGILTLRLRNMSDTSKAETPLVIGKEILAGNHREEAKPVIETPPPVASPPVVAENKGEAPKFETFRLTIIDGGRVTRHTYRQHENGDITEEDAQASGPVPQRRLQPQPQAIPAKGSKGPARDF